MSEKTMAIIALFAWAMLSLYLGIGGTLKTENYNQIEKDYNFSDTAQVADMSGMVYKNLAEMLLAKEDEKSARFFPFLPVLPDFVASILTACFFGMLGGVIAVMRDVALKKIKLEQTCYISIPLLGFFTGLVVLGLNYLVPAILVSGEHDIRPMTLLFFALFAGMYADEFYQFISSATRSRIFKNDTKTNTP